jgi:hypothetical protein
MAEMLQDDIIRKQMIGNTRLLEVMMKDSMKIEIDEKMVCGIERTSKIYLHMHYVHY